MPLLTVPYRQTRQAAALSVVTTDTYTLNATLSNINKNKNSPNNCNANNQCKLVTSIHKQIQIWKQTANHNKTKMKTRACQGQTARKKVFCNSRTEEARDKIYRLPPPGNGSTRQRNITEFFSRILLDEEDQNSPSQNSTETNNGKIEKINHSICKNLSKFYNGMHAHLITKNEHSWNYWLPKKDTTSFVFQNWDVIETPRLLTLRFQQRKHAECNLLERWTQSKKNTNRI